MDWYWCVLIVLGILILIGVCVGHSDDYDEDYDELFRASAVPIINDLKYTRPETWAKAASEIMGRHIDPPTPEQIAEWEKNHKK